MLIATSFKHFRQEIGEMNFVKSQRLVLLSERRRLRSKEAEVSVSSGAAKVDPRVSRRRASTEVEEAMVSKVWCTGCPDYEGTEGSPGLDSAAEDTKELLANREPPE
ncbi:hypothetical protein G6F67_009604 [Rhizopus microsporus]|nr:hypothetical protein G6F67_009604 [Rhizopus microsporus]